MSQLEGVLREGTATPSEPRLGPDENGGSSFRLENGSHGGVIHTKGRAEDDEEEEVEELNDVNSMPEMANDSSAEEEDLGEDEQTLLETLSIKLRQRSCSSLVNAASTSTATLIGSGGDAEGAGLTGVTRVEGTEDVAKVEEDYSTVQLAVLRKLLLNKLVEHLSLLEEVGGMRAICYLQVIN